ncbi:MAG: bifunctional nicotinamidase/pyrazinamidase [Saprospiraceae bacterium]|nr:bifunctional nicotinamidase/pyrazinamidase [Saprospiraceae bacterium]
MRALLVIDIQIDFCPGGALEVKEGDAVIPVANMLMDQFDWVIATQDWHPANHKSFAANHPWRYPGQVIDLNGLSQILWPIHCVQDRFGAEFAPGLHTEKVDKIIYKGTDPEIDSYSGFYDNGHRQSTGLADFLKEKEVTSVYVLGLAADYCVKYTVLDALALGFKTYLVTDGTRGVNLEPQDTERAIKEMSEKGAILVESTDI